MRYQMSSYSIYLRFVSPPKNGCVFPECEMSVLQRAFTMREDVYTPPIIINKISHDVTRAESRLEDFT